MTKTQTSKSSRSNQNSRSNRNNQSTKNNRNNQSNKSNRNNQSNKSSISNQSKNQVRKTNQPSRKRRKIKRKIVIATICFLVAILVAGCYFGYNYIFKHQPKLDQPEQEVKKEEEQPTDPKVEELKKLYEENNDLYGWIKIDGTKIDYPVMYTEGKDYYLDRDFYKKKSSAGSLFIDKHNTIEPRDVNLLIHGHSMKDGSMFRALLNYKSKKYYNKHKTFTFYTTKEKEEYEIIAVFVSQVYKVKDKVFKYYKFYNATNEEEYNDYIKNIKKLSLFDIEATAKYPDKLITLSTCEYSRENGRMVVVGRKI